jgi:hypothetical protein
MMSKLAQLIGKREGFGVTGALPTRNNNPGDLMHAPGEDHPADAPNSIGSFPTPQQGWAALEEQLQRWADRGLTIAQAITLEAPPSCNDTAEYIDFICNELPAPSTMTVAQALEIT